jgi:DNA polymerase (family 10)
MQDKFFIATALREIGRLLHLKGENPFKSRAYEHAAQALQAFEGDLDALVTNRRLTEIHGVGSGIAAVIEELCRSGLTPALDELRAGLPAGAAELSTVPGLTLKKIIALHDALRIETIPDLKTACEKGLVRNVKGFGQKAEVKLLAAIEKLENKDERILLDKALEEGERLLRYIRTSPEVTSADITGPLRRRKETIRRVQIIAVSENAESVANYFCRYPAAIQSGGLTGNHCNVRLAGGADAELTIVAPSNYLAALHDSTGSAKYIAKIEVLARSKGISIDLPTRRNGAEKKSGAKEEREIYRELGMQYVPPELREDQGEIEAALSGMLPSLVNLEDIQGMTHCHTLYSDGKNSVEEMALAAEQMGMKYLTITDHSPSASYAGGVKIDRLKAQWEEIARVQEKVKVRLLRGTESDILQDGSLDYPDPILEQFDIIIASIHVRYKLDVDQMTRRILGAMRLPFFKVWGHPLGRLVLSRPPLECHIEKVLDAIAESRAAIEVNGDPRRLDLEPRWIRAAKERGIKFIVSTDAHSIKNLRNLRYGVFMSRRGWLTRDEVLNTRGTKEFMKAVHP